MELYSRIYSYISEYQRLVYDYYSKHSVAFLVTYYNINVPETVWDDELLNGGYYEKIGTLTGVKFNKYLLLPVYFIDEIATSFDGQDIGEVKENTTSFVIPSSYGLTPYPNDVIKLEQSYLRPTNNVYPLYKVSGVEISANTDKRFWKVKIETEQSRTTTEIDQQVENTMVFFDYDKKVHTLSRSTTLTKLLVKNESLRANLKSAWDDNSGYYFII